MQPFLQFAVSRIAPLVDVLRRPSRLAQNRPRGRSSLCPTSCESRVDSALPTGTVTFLFTDIEGSTALWERHPEAMQAALARHDRTLREAVESCSGVIVKTTGDGAYAVFRAAKDALAASLAAQRVLQSAPSSSASDLRIALKVRMGLHTGEAELRDGDYYGPTLNRGARIMSAAQGEQVLMSATTGELLKGQLPEDVTLRDIGEHRLKGLLNPMRLLQVIAAGLRLRFPLASNAGHSLPAERDTFVGRQESLDELSRRLQCGARLVSVLGIGGTGKTRLVTRFGWSALETYIGGIWFCDLAQARDVDGILQAVAQGLGVPLGKEDPTSQLGHAIAGRGQCLMILDNFEQVARHAEETLGEWLNRASTAQFIVTTREVLGLPGEEALSLAPLAAPDATTLFLRRAEAAKPGFKPSPGDQAAIPPLVKLLDGLPLAIELAAARVRVMSPRVLLLRMRERFKLLTSTGHRLDRQATLRGVFDWSWDLLSAPEKAALAQLSVFQGGFTLEAMETVLDLSALDDAPWPVDALQSLVEKSLVRQVGDDRFDLLVSVQEYAAEHLANPSRYPGSGPDALAAAEARHGSHFAALDDRAAVANGFADVDNFVVACRRAARRGDAETAANALRGAWVGIEHRGPFAIGIDLAAAVQRIPGIAGAAAAKAGLIAGRAQSASGKRSEARDRFEFSLRAARTAGDRDCECAALIGLGYLEMEGGGNAGKARMEAARVLARELSDRVLECEAENGLGNAELGCGPWEHVLLHYEAALDLARQIGNRYLEGSILGNLATAYWDVGQTDASIVREKETLAIAREVGDRRLEGNTLCNIGLRLLMQGRLREALDQLDASLTVARDLGHVLLQCVVMCNLGIVQQRLGELGEARACFDASLAIAHECGLRRIEGQTLGYLGLLHANCGRFEDARTCLDTGEMILRELSDQTSIGILLCCRVEVDQRRGAADAAQAALVEAEAIAVEVGAGANSELGVALSAARRA